MKAEISNVVLSNRYNKWEAKDSTYRVVGFEVKPHSVDSQSLKAKEKTCSPDFSTAKRQLVAEDTKEIIFSYDVSWKVTFDFCCTVRSSG